MEKPLKINGRSVVLRSSLYTHIAYKSQFGEQLLADYQKLLSLSDSIKDEQDKVKTARLMSERNILVLQILWTLIREGTPDTATFEEWLKDTESVDLPQIIAAETELILSTMTADRKNG